MQPASRCARWRISPQVSGSCFGPAFPPPPRGPLPHRPLTVATLLTPSSELVHPDSPENTGQPPENGPPRRKALPDAPTLNRSCTELRSTRARYGPPPRG